MPKEMKPITTELDRAIFHIFPQFCKGCGLCKEKCPNDVLIWSEKLGVYGTPSVKPKDEDSCIACSLCEMICPDAAIYIEKKAKKKKAAQ